MEKSLKKKKFTKNTIAQNRFTTPPSKVKAISALTLLVLGVAFMPTGFLLSNYIQDQIDKGIAEQKQVPHPHNEKFEEWISDNYEDAPEMYKTYRMWNLINPDAYLAGATPQYEEVGPFTFRQYTTKYDIDFSESKDSVTYKKFNTFVQVGGENISEVKITNINPGFLGSVMEAGGTTPELTELMFPMLLDEVRTIFVDELNTVMAWTLAPENISLMLVDALGGLIEPIEELLGEDTADFISEILAVVLDSIDIILPMEELSKLMTASMPSALDIMYEEWANDYFPEVNVDLTDLIQYLKDNLDSEDLRLFLVSVAEDILDNNDSFIARLLGFFLNLFGWLLRSKLIQKIVDFFIDLLIDLIAGSAIQTLLEGLLSDMIRDLGAELVDSEGGPDGQGVDIDGREPYGFTDYPGASPSDLNIAEHEDGGSGIELPVSYALWDNNDPYSLTGFNYLENKIWYDAMEGDEDSIAFLTDHFGITKEQLEMITDWIAVGVSTWSKNAGGWTLNDWNSGLVVTRTAEEWLFTGIDTAVLKHQVYYDLDPSLAEVNLFDNCANAEEAEAAEVPSLKMKTGRDNIDKVNQIVEYDGQKEIFLWNEPIEVEGTDGTQFATKLTEDDTLKVFNTDLMRVVELEYDDTDEIYDIDLLKFELSDETFEPNSLYFMDTKGLINLAEIPSYRDVPVRVSKPHFLDADAALLVAVEGMNPDASEHDTYVCVEPISGITMKARQRIQINLEIGPMINWYQNISHAAMPILWMEDSGEVPEDLAEEFKAVYDALELKERVPMIALGIGAALCVPGVAVSTTQSEKRKRKTIAEILPKKKAMAKKQMLIKSSNSQEIERQVSEIRRKLGLDTEGPKNIDDNKPKDV